MGQSDIPGARSPSRRAGRFLISLHVRRPTGGAVRTEGFLAQVLQRRRNHQTFSMRTVAQERRPDLLMRFRIDRTPTLPRR